MLIEELITAEDIISCFSGAISADFAGYERDGIEEIDWEISFQSDVIRNHLSNDLLKHLDSVNGEVVVVKNGVVTLLAVPQVATLRFTLMPLSSCHCSCHLEEVAFTAISGSDTSFEVDLETTCGEHSRRLLASYDIDQDAMEEEYLALRNCLRSLVAYSLGARLFPSADGIWSVVQYHKEIAERCLASLKDWKPFWMRKMVLYRPLPVLKVNRA